MALGDFANADMLNLLSSQRQDTSNAQQASRENQYRQEQMKLQAQLAQQAQEQERAYQQQQAQMKISADVEEALRKEHGLGREREKMAGSYTPGQENLDHPLNLSNAPDVGAEQVGGPVGLGGSLRGRSQGMMGGPREGNPYQGSMGGPEPIDVGANPYAAAYQPGVQKYTSYEQQPGREMTRRQYEELNSMKRQRPQETPQDRLMLEAFRQQGRQDLEGTKAGFRSARDERRFKYEQEKQALDLDWQEKKLGKIMDFKNADLNQRWDETLAKLRSAEEVSNNKNATDRDLAIARIKVIEAGQDLNQITGYQKSNAYFMSNPEDQAHVEDMKREAAKKRAEIEAKLQDRGHPLPGSESATVRKSGPTQVPQRGAARTVKMKFPDGSEHDVSAADVALAKRKGGVVIQ